MVNYIVQFILNSFGIFIIWFLILEGKDFKLFSKKGFYVFLALTLAVTLIKVRL